LRNGFASMPRDVTSSTSGGITSNVVAASFTTTSAFISAGVGLLVLRFWSFARGYESARDELKELARDARLAAMIVELTVDALAARQTPGTTSTPASDELVRSE
jgi:hypothetical protein